MKIYNRKTGQSGEKIAAEYLSGKNYKIVERNFSTRFGEIDIICYDGNILVFVEVKTKIGHDFGEPEEMINKNKLGRVRRMGEWYMTEKKLDCPCRVDVVAVVLDKDNKVERLDHYEAVY